MRASIDGHFCYRLPTLILYVSIASAKPVGSIPTIAAECLRMVYSLAHLSAKIDVFLI